MHMTWRRADPVARSHFRLAVATLCLAWLACAAKGAELRIVGVEEPPGSFAGEDGEASGISVDYVREIQRRVGNRDRISIVPETDALKLAETQPNVVAFSFSRTEEREDQFRWIAQVFRKPWVLYVRSDSKLQIARIADMRRIRRIGVTAGDVRASWLKKQGFTNLSARPTPEENLARLLAGNIDAFFFEPQGVAFYCQKLRCPRGEPRRLYSPRSSDVYIMMSKQTPEATVRKWKDAAAQIKSDGTFERIAKKWVQKTAADYGIDSALNDGVLIFR